MPKTRVTAVVITHGDRWQFLSQMIKSALKDENVVKLIIVDNGSQNKEEIERGTSEYGDRVVILRHEKNLGSAGGFAAGIEYARKTDCDFVYLSDDDMAPEEGFVSKYLEARKFFPDQKIVISGHRADLHGNTDVFYQQTIRSAHGKRTFFDIFAFDKLIKFIRPFFGWNKKNRRGPFVPIIPTRGFVYGGAFIPIEAVRKAPLPDASLFLYGDDIEYSWGIEELGYACYASVVPVIRDVDITFSESHIFGLFEKSLAPFKAYYRIRNMTRLSLRHSKQNKAVLFFSIIVWIIGLLALGLLKQGLTAHYLKRSKLIIDAVWCGYFPQSKFAKNKENTLF